MSQLAAGILQMSPHKPLELFQLGRLVDQNVLGDRVKLFSFLDGFTGVFDDTVVDQIEGGQMCLHGVAANGIVVPGAVFQDRARGTLR